MTKRFASPGINLLFLILLLLANSAALSLKAQIYEPDGLRMPGSWNNWQNEPGMGGDFDLQVNKTGTLRWQSTFKYTGNTGLQEFKFVSTAFGDPWGNQWAANPSVQLNQLNDFVFGNPADPNNSVNLSQDKWYTIVFEDLGYQNCRAVFMETTNNPVELNEVLQQPIIVADMESVTITLKLSDNPSSEEKFFVRYTTDGWENASFIPMQGSGNSLTAVIPGLASETEVEYYVLSSVASDLSADADLLTLGINNNNNLNYSYIVDQQFGCGNGIGLMTSEPAFPRDNIPVTLYFNAEYGNGGLFDFEGEVYAHTGVITNLSSGNSDWKYVKTQWGENTPETKLTRISENLYSLTIPNPRTYYGVPASESILKMSFVFRSELENDEGNYQEHKNADGSDIFVDVYELRLNVKIISPNRREPLASPNTVLPVCVEALENDYIKLFLNDTQLTLENNSSLSYPLVLQGLPPGSHWIKAEAGDGAGIVRDSVQIYLRGPVDVAALPEGMKNGVNYISDNSVTLVLHDPAGQKNFAFAIGEYSNWLPSDETYMKRTPDGKHYWVTLSGLQSGKEYAYQFYVDGTLKVADPYCEKILDPWNDRWIPVTTYPNLKPYPFDKTTGVVSVFQTAQIPYSWQVNNFVPPAVHETQSDLLIYELLVRDFVETRSIDEVSEKLTYLKSIGVNAVQLMPIIEFDGNESWGYAPNFFFATDKYYGTKTAYKDFIDAAHSLDMAVILDIVPNHTFGQSPLALLYFDPEAGEFGQPSGSNPWLNPVATHPYSVGYDFNHESPHTRQFFKDVFSHWLTEFRVDGFRIDLSKGLTQTNSGEDVGAWSAYDQSRINILNDYYTHIKSVNPNAYMILEHLGDNNEETVLANTGMLPWSAMHDTYKQVAMGWPDNSNVSWAYHASRGWTYPNLIDYMENHDEERLMFENLSWGNGSGDYNIKDTLTSLGHLEQAVVLFLGIPGPKMLWQFQEMGYDYSIMFGGDRLANKPPRWDYLDQPAREKLARVVGAMAKLRKSDAFRFGTFTHDLAGLGKRMWLTHSSMDVVMAVNMGVQGFDMALGFTKTGTWYDYFTGESLTVTDAAGHSLYIGPGSYRVFTSVPLARPFHSLTVNVVRQDNNNPISGATVKLADAGNRLTNSSGTAEFLAVPQSFALTVEKFGYLTKTVEGVLSNDLTLTVQLVVDVSNTDELKLPEGIRFYPNPAKESLTIVDATACLISIYSIEGRLLKTEKIQQPGQSLSLDGLTAGVYLLHLSGPQGTRIEQFIIN